MLILAFGDGYGLYTAVNAMIPKLRTGANLAEIELLHARGVGGCPARMPGAEDARFPARRDILYHQIRF